MFELNKELQSLGSSSETYGHWDLGLMKLVQDGTLVVPSPAVAQHFAVESLWDGKAVPFGVHKPWWAYNKRYTSHRLLELLEVCPEIKILCPYATRSRANKDSRHGKAAQIFVKMACLDHVS